jgi:3-carboxy-cis,cis-muconate cycloisomerase
MTPFDQSAQLQAMLDVEVALARALADVGIIPATAAVDIETAAHSDRFDVSALHADAERAGNVAIPLVRRLTELVAAVNPESARHVHRGATSQDILDTAFVLQLRSAAPALVAALARVMISAAGLARTYATTPMPGRTWLQQASPTTFGLKAAGWLDLLGRCRERVNQAVDRALVIQLGGASGTLAALGDGGPAVVETMARRLGLGVPDIPWHTLRDRFVDVAAALGTTCGALGKIGRDLVLLAQSEVGEAFEAPESGRGGSSSMPHKQNPVRAVAAVAASVRAPGLVATMLAAMPQEHERAAGAWQAEWSTLPELITLTAHSAEATALALTELTVVPERMRGNLEVRGGVAMAEALSNALSEYMPRGEASSHVERLSRAAVRTGCQLREVAAADAVVSQWMTREDLERLLTPEQFIGSARVFVDRVLQRWGV